METDRSQKSRSLGLESKTAAQARSARPPLTDRHQSSPSVPRQSQNPGHSKKVSSATKASVTSQRSSHASVRDDGKPPEHVRSTSHFSRRGSATPGEAETPPLISLVVIGSEQCGKSAFISGTLDLKSTNTFISASKVAMNGFVCKVQLLELCIENVDFGNGRRVAWPQYINACHLPRIDGVFCLYDSTDMESTDGLREALSALSSSSTPTLLVACKTDKTSTPMREMNSRFQEKVRQIFPTVTIAESSYLAPDGQKRCLSALLTTILSLHSHSEQPDLEASISRSTSNAALSQSRSTSPSKAKNRSRSNSRLQMSKSKELLLNLTRRQPVVETAEETSYNENSSSEEEPPLAMRTKLRLNTNYPTGQIRRPAEPQTPVSSSEPPAHKFMYPGELGSQRIPQTPESFNKQSLGRPGTAETADSRAHQTFLYDDDSHDDSPREKNKHINASIEELRINDSAKGEVGVPFQELVDRLLQLQKPKQDKKFVATFLCLYRAFATPHQLIVAIVDRFAKLERSIQPSKAAEMLGCLQVLYEWASTYPGDLSHGRAREQVLAFVQSVEKTNQFVPAVRDISNNLEVIIADDDLDWAYDDAPKSARSKSSTTSSGQTPNSSLASIASSIDGDMSRSLVSLPSNNRSSETEDTEDDATLVDSIAPSTSVQTGVIPSQSVSNLLDLDHARRQARAFRLRPHIPLSKLQWHLFMDTPVEELAREITRIDWAMFSSVRPRDFIRHISLTKEQRRRSHKSDNLGFMVKHFNHLALFVSGMILLRDKPKHRANALDKFMALAWKVRQMNNYNSLGAIVAGVNSHEIDRLTMTKDLIPPETHKEFLRLTVLMGISKSHFAYRTAWENSFNERVPFVPLLQQDLTRAECGNPTFIGSNVNWKKYEIMGDVIVGIQKSMEQSYKFPVRCAKSDEIVKLILETKVVDEAEDSADPGSELYERSIQVEPMMSADTRKRFDWLRR